MQPLRIFLWHLAILTLCLLFSSRFSRRDPSSIFFSRSSFTPIYSAGRQTTALDFLNDTSFLVSLEELPPRPSKPQPTLCLGMMTMARQGSLHFPAALGSLLEGLSASQLLEIDIKVFFADLDPEEHPSYHAPWLRPLTDSILTRPGSGSLETARKFVKAKENAWKSTLDYQYLLSECYENSTAPYIAILEDDIIASGDWFNRTMDAVDALEARGEVWVYLRLFYAEMYLGWNSEEWIGVSGYGVYIFLLFSLVLASLLASKKWWNRQISQWTIAVVMLVCFPLSVLAFFAAGRLTMMPLRRGLVRMDDYGCCSQGLVFARDAVPRILEKLDPKASRDFPDQRIETIEGPKWALVPCVVQHVGRKSAGGIKRQTWNFRFEMEHRNG